MTAEEKKLIEAHNGDMALYYIWRKAGVSGGDEQAARDLCMTRERISAAKELLSTYGIIFEAPSPAPVPPPEEVVREYTAEDVSEIMKSDRNFSSVVQQAELVFGRTLSTTDLRQLCGIYNHMGIPADVMFVLLCYCGKMSDRRLTMNYVSKVASSWLELGISSAEQAEQYMENAVARKKRMGEILSILGYREKVTPGIAGHISSWIEAGRSDSEIEQAYDITLERTGKLSWAYLSKVLEGFSSEKRERDEEIPELPSFVKKKKE